MENFMAVTIKDIAKKVGVNPSTVSRVINGTAAISEETKKKITAAMKELDYHPNIQARSLVNGSTFTIGLVMDAGNSDAYANTFFIKSVTAIEEVTQRLGYNLLITNHTEREKGNAVRNLVLEHKIDGIILPVSGITEDLISLLTANHFPFVVMGEPDESYIGRNWVDMDNEEGGRLAVNHLLQCGYRHPVLFVENKGTIFEQKRIRGFLEELRINGLSPSKNDIIESGVNRTEIADKIKLLLETYRETDSIICTNNMVAYHVLQKLKQKNISVPEQIGIITFDNYPLAEYLDPPLTAVDIDTYLLGERAASTLFDMIKHQDRKEESILIETKIIARKSTGKRW
ncbi:LacI family DNA-binding transcriptional regulator [Parablautia muri]|nr:LacI family DNA-binding transcriptional regulator [Parablautia muri]